jgi:hypothetical protein
VLAYSGESKEITCLRGPILLSGVEVTICRRGWYDVFAGNKINGLGWLRDDGGGKLNKEW